MTTYHFPAFQSPKPGRPAVFLDRDGTIIEECHYLANPADVRLLPGAAAGILHLRAAGFACVLVSNQSGVGRGYFSERTLQMVHTQMVRLLEQEGAFLDGVYYCTAAPLADAGGLHPDRKPNPGMLLRAARDMSLSLGQSWIVGDSDRDILAGRNAGCRGGVLVRSGHDIAGALQTLGPAVLVAQNLHEAALRIARHFGRKSA